MSYTVAVCTQPVPADDRTAWRELDALIAQKGPVPPVFHELLDRLTARHPCICDLPDDEADDGVWTDGPLRANAGHRATTLGIVSTRVGDVLPFLVRTANDLGLTVFDRQSREIRRA